jgi:hypothetical protein
MHKSILKLQQSSFMNQPRQLSFSFYSLVAREPAFWMLYQPYIWWSKFKRQAAGFDPQECQVTLNTELVIDGFQGSANSFATEAFQLCQTRSVRLAHHLHSPIQIIKAVQYQVPVWLTIRAPDDTVISLTSRWPHLSVEQGLRGYIGFYQKLLPYTPSCMVSSFQQTTQQLDQLVRTLNHKFGTHFDIINVETVNQTIKPRTHNTSELQQRKPIKEAKKLELEQDKNMRLLTEANAIYCEYTKLQSVPRN